MKYWCGYLTAAIFAAFSWVLMQFGEKYQMLVDMVYPYVTKTVQSVLSQWTSGVDFLVWQTILVLLVVLVIGSLVVYLVCKGNLIQWLGWVLAGVSVVFFLNTAVYGLNEYAGPLTEDLRLEQRDYSTEELTKAAAFYRDKANELAVQLPRDEKGAAKFSDFDTLAELTAGGFRNLTLDHSFSVYGGTYPPVKKLTWSGLFSSMGITGITVPLTGESAVNPDIPGVALPFTMARETARRMCISRDSEAEFSAFLACEANESPEYRYSAYFMAYRYCHMVLSQIDAAAAQELSKGCVKELTWDLNEFDQHFKSAADPTAAYLADQANTAYRTVSGTEQADSGTICDMLTAWYLENHTDLLDEPEVPKFDPFDENQVDLSGIVNAKPRPQPEATEGAA